jgi:hypothetical protein
MRYFLNPVLRLFPMTAAVCVLISLPSFSVADVSQKLSQRSTINVFAPFLWLYEGKSGINEKNYGLIWDGYCIPDRNVRKDTIYLLQSFWDYYSRDWHKVNIDGQDGLFPPAEFRTSQLYGKPNEDQAADNFRYWTDINAEGYEKMLADYFAADSASRFCPKLDGVIFDDWNTQYQPSGMSANDISAARRSIAKYFRSRFGEDFLIFGNVNTLRDKATVDQLNGVYIEFAKNGGEKRLYNSQELKELERTLTYYNENLRRPRIIAIDGWRKTLSMTLDDMNSTENRRMAKLLTAMSVVIPDNGYIMYGDNNSDDGSSDHFHLFYDFYNFDIGKPVGGRIEIRNGAGYKEHQEGFIAYNISNGKQTFTRSNGETIEIEAKSGLFCKNAGPSSDCLSYD